MDNPAERLIAAAQTSEEVVIDRAILPQSLNDYIGQAAVKPADEYLYHGRTQRSEALDHTLIFGPPGLGKLL